MIEDNLPILIGAGMLFIYFVIYKEHKFAGSILFALTGLLMIYYAEIGVKAFSPEEIAMTYIIEAIGVIITITAFMKTIAEGIILYAKRI